MATNWFRTGVISEEEAKTAFSPGGGSKSRRPMRDNRFWLPHGEKSEVLFLDGNDDGFRIFEHDFEIHGRFGNTPSPAPKASTPASVRSASWPSAGGRRAPAPLSRSSRSSRSTTRAGGRPGS